MNYNRVLIQWIRIGEGVYQAWNPLWDILARYENGKYIIRLKSK